MEILGISILVLIIHQVQCLDNLILIWFFWGKCCIQAHILKKANENKQISFITSETSLKY